MIPIEEVAEIVQDLREMNMVYVYCGDIRSSYNADRNVYEFFQQVVLGIDANDMLVLTKLKYSDYFY
jgi:hypothetical protein